MLAQTAENPVCLAVDGEPDNENTDTDDKSRVGKPLVSIAMGEGKDVTAVEIGVA